jgi:hypothetical protein
MAGNQERREDGKGEVIKSISREQVGRDNGHYH